MNHFHQFLLHRVSLSLQCLGFSYTLPYNYDFILASILPVVCGCLQKGKQRHGKEK